MINLDDLLFAVSTQKKSAFLDSHMEPLTEAVKFHFKNTNKLPNSVLYHIA